MSDDSETTAVTTSSPARPRRRLPFFARILAAMLLGVIAGLAFGPRAEPLGQLGNVIIGLIKTLAAPLLSSRSWTHSCAPRFDSGAD